ncbi:MAG: dienelactone hydrolase family protein [Candidatus Hydrogenedentes bacterium]|nr:dienelactone hydrolase family protein [Candidatus Hydrogenedentota bacterium]
MFSLLLIAFAAAPVSQGYVPNEYVDPDTGHRVVRLTRAPGEYTSFYFHQNPFTVGGDKMVCTGVQDGRNWLLAIDMKTYAMDRLCECQDAGHVIVAPKRREVFHLRGETILATHIDTKETREIGKISPEWVHGAGFTVNSDETLLAGTFADGIAEWFKKPRGEWFGGIHGAHLPNGLYTVEIATGKINVFYRENEWLTHIQFSPTDPGALSFCHEGPWEKVQRIWVIRADGTGLKAIHERTMENEIAGHEFWDPSGRMLWFDLQTPAWKNFSLAGADVQSGKETRYPLNPDHWSFHYNIAPDGSMFCGDGGASQHGRDALTNGIYLYRPKDGSVEPEMLCRLTGHDYALEPCVHFTPDSRWVVFRSNMHGRQLVYAVEVAKAADKTVPHADKSHVANFYPFMQEYADTRPVKLSYLSKEWPDRDAWAAQGRAKMSELLAYHPDPAPAGAEILETTQKTGYVRYRVRFHVTADRTTEAFLLIPDGLKGPAPAVIALHDHGAFYYYGKEKICETENPLPVLKEHIDSSYGGRPYADELARHGFVVLAPDAFYFGSQRIEAEQLSQVYAEPMKGLAPGSNEYVEKHKALAGRQEEIIAKTLFDAGTTWPGVLFQGDRAAVDYLVTRPEVDANRIGCIGLSIGGFRSAHLFALDPRIKVGVVAGWMTTYGSLVYDHLHFHTWMIFVPGQLDWLDLPDVVTLNAPRPLMVVDCLQDVLFTHEGMRAAEKKIGDVYTRMGAPDHFACRYDDVPHSFNPPAQDAAIAWLERWLKDTGAN